jgi:hypothetical protein
MLRKIYGSNREEVVGRWRRLYNEELCNLHTSLNITKVIKLRRMRWAGYTACKGEMRSAYNIIVRKSEGKGPCGRSRCRWEDNVRIDLKETV